VSSSKRSTTTATPASERGKRTEWLSETTSRAVVRGAGAHETIARVKSDEPNGFDPGARVSVNKAYKMYVGGAFVRSESGRYFQVRGGDAEGSADPSVVNVPRGSRKDARDAVLAAKNAADGWAARTAYNRGQILYRLAEVMESRRDELRVALVRGGLEEAKAAREVELSVDRAVYYAGFCDKFQSLVASHNPVAGPHFGFSLPEPMGVVAVVAPQRPALLGLVSTALPVIAGGNTCVVLASSEDPRSAIVWCECLATSDLPGGVVNVLTGQASEMAPHLAKHREVTAMDVWSDDADLRAAAEREGSGNVKRVRTHDAAATAALAESTGQGLGYIERFLETKTVWHPVGV
jgi:acyl-CoA reductase-like NAD-dependent aldehyde dehydrogenase